jgi:hypothetical protein
MGVLATELRHKTVLRPVGSVKFSALTKHRFNDVTISICGGGTDLAVMRPMKGLLASKAVFEGIAPSEVYTR